MLEIDNYGVAVTTLEQVFLDIGHDPNPRPRFAARNQSMFENGDESLSDSNVGLGDDGLTIDPDNTKG